METLVLRFKSKKNYKLVKELASLLEDQKGSYGIQKKTTPRRKPKSEKELSVMSVMSKNKVIDKEALKSKAELIKELPKSKFKSEKHFLSYAGSMKGQYISKEHLRDRVWRKRA